MEDKKESNAWMSVPAFGDWDLKNGMPDYSLDFSKIRETRKQNKRDISRTSLGNEDDLNPQDHRHQSQSRDHHHRPRTPPVDLHRPHHLHRRDNSPTGRKKFMSYFQCCIRA
ncbi:uncharacterized protein LOC120103699 isoform X2 [Phoenix dactylifera]|uniref:Uncharacterized protein LOC103700658 isoform X2 n=1 Tax=Phoenix dactylifera TaxID=42345 RepID=A0A8B7BL82_PHODC|nr:uncharacterized protein LOC103700658 isoform X2 [Phoenix dactylifera]XP_038985940.1 uncharacterized protein LOC120103699 isoform X2 [Phoenix dactylifera]